MNHTTARRLPLFAACLLLLLLVSPAVGAEEATVPLFLDEAESCVEAPLEGGVVETASQCAAFANCGGGVTISCTDTTNPAECSSLDQNCGAGIRGRVTCNGSTTWCSPCSCIQGSNCARGCGSGSCSGGVCNCDA